MWPAGRQVTVTQSAGRLGGVDRAPKALAHQAGQVAGVVNVGVGEQDGVNLLRGQGEGLPVHRLPPASALEQPAIHQVAVPVDPQQEAGTRYGSGRPQEG